MNTVQEKMSPSVLIEGDVTEQIIGAAFRVLNTLGAGFLEKVYENALSLELQRSGLTVEHQKTFSVNYMGRTVGEYHADLVVAGKVIIECKAVSNLDAVHEAQLINYLKASGIHVGLVINFGRPKLQHRRFVI